MRKKTFSSLIGIENDRMVLPEMDAEFLLLLQKGLLLALKEEGLLTQMQYRYAEEKLRQQLHDKIRKGRGMRVDSSSKLLPCFHQQGGSGKFF